jgi:hypothetical protein
MSAQSYTAIILIGLTILFSTPCTMATETSNAMLKEYEKEVGGTFSADSGKQFWYKDNDGRSCTSCHTDSLLVKGRHERTGKIIEPMAPSVNSERLTEVKKINKWFLRNCKWTIGRECTTSEKGDILLWLSKQ